MTKKARLTQGVERSSHEVSDQQTDRSAELGRYLYKIITCGENIRISQSPENPLSMNEMLALLLPVLGYRHKECAVIMEVDPSTFKEYQKRLRQKLGAKSSMDALYIALIKGYCRVLTNQELEAICPTFRGQMLP